MDYNLWVIEKGRTQDMKTRTKSENDHLIGNTRIENLVSFGEMYFVPETGILARMPYEELYYQCHVHTTELGSRTGAIDFGVIAEY